MTRRSLGLALALAGCARHTDNSRPLARAADGATASLTVVACGPHAGALVRSLVAEGPLVAAVGGGAAVVSLNTCGTVP
jgi:hypothetical protein